MILPVMTAITLRIMCLLFFGGVLMGAFDPLHAMFGGILCIGFAGVIDAIIANSAPSKKED